MKHYYIYILTNQKNGTLYIGVTNDLRRRVEEHKLGMIKGFTQQYKLTRLIYYEVFDSIESAITREKYLKKWKRDWKLKLIEQVNPNWWDLAVNFL